MSNYTKSTNFATKDNLASGDPLKIVKGTEIDTEYNNIATAIATKTDNASAAITGGTITGVTLTSSNVTITGGSITGITDLAIADGGTGASTAATALNNLLPSQGGNANKYLQTDATNATWDSINLGSGDITGTLAVGNGGTGITSFGTGVGIFLGSPTSSNLASAVTDETGTGALVFANSPTLVTPALGTPASGVATNLTGLPLSTGISGLGTGVATALAINTPNTGAIVVSGGALGTPSSGTVTNLTGSAFININGMVGNSTPNSGSFTTLNTSSTVTINGGTANGIGFLNGSKVFTTGTVLKFDGTNITSDRSSGTAYSGTSFFTWANGIVLNNSATPATGLLNSLYFTNSANMQNVFGVVQNASGYGDFVWAGYSGSYAEAMRLTSSGLAVTGTISATTAIATTSGGTGLTSFTSGGVVYASSSSALATGSALTFDGTTLSVSGGRVNASTADAGGTIGSTAQFVTVNTNGSVGDFSGIRFNYFNSGDSGGKFAYIGAVLTSGATNGIADIVFGVKSSTATTTITEQLRLTSTSLYTASGINVGIGTSNMGARLSVVKDINGGNIGTSFQQELVNNNGASVGDWTGTIYRWLPNNANTNQAYIGAIVTSQSGDTLSDLVFGVKNSTTGNTIVEAMRIKQGNVGIGTSSPASKLDVVGTIKGSTTISVGAATPSASGAGITFPATQSASSNANTLDDYEEGTWTPTIIAAGGSGSPTYSSNTGFYTKIGNIVIATAFIAFTKNTLSGGVLQSGGFPFAANSTTIYPQAACYITAGSLITNPLCQVAAGFSVCDVLKSNVSTGAVASVAISELGTGSLELRYTITYQV